MTFLLPPLIILTWRVKSVHSINKQVRTKHCMQRKRNCRLWKKNLNIATTINKPQSQRLTKTSEVCKIQNNILHHLYILLCTPKWVLNCMQNCMLFNWELYAIHIFLLSNCEMFSVQLWTMKCCGLWEAKKSCEPEDKQ